MEVMSEEEFLASRGASSFGFGEAALHKAQSRQSRKQRQRQLDHQAAKDAALYRRRIALRDEYERLIANGEIRKPTRIERLEKIAAGHPDNECVQAARKLLADRASQGGGA